MSWLIVRQAFKPVFLGLLLAVGLSLVLRRVIAAFLFGVGPSDPYTYGVVIVTMLVVATLASVGPVLGATRTDPQSAIRDE